MWPTDARTSKPSPRNFEIVFAFAGDSTITRALGMLFHRGVKYGLDKDICFSSNAL